MFVLYRRSRLLHACPLHSPPFLQVYVCSSPDPSQILQGRTSPSRHRRRPANPFCSNKSERLAGSDSVIFNRRHGSKSDRDPVDSFNIKTGHLQTSPLSQGCRKIKPPRSSTFPTISLYSLSPNNDKLRIFSGSANPALSQEIAHHLGIGVEKIDIKIFYDKKIAVLLPDNVEGCNVFLVQPTCPSVNDNFRELCNMIDVCCEGSAKKSPQLYLTLVMQGQIKRHSLLDCNAANWALFALLLTRPAGITRFNF